MKALMSSAGIELAVDEYFQFEVFILQTLNFKLRYTSPQEHFDSFLARFPYQKKLFQQALPSLILLTLIHPQACEFTSEEIFFGAVLSVLEIVPLTLNDSQQRLLNSLTNNWEAATRVKELIEEQTRLAEEDEEDLQDEWFQFIYLTLTSPPITSNTFPHLSSHISQIYLLRESLKSNAKMKGMYDFGS